MGGGGGGLTQLSNPSLITQVSSNPERNKMYHPLFLRVKKLIPTKVMHIFTLYRSESKPFIYTGFPKISIIYIDRSDSDTVHSIQLDPHVLESPPKLLESIYIRLVHLCNVQASTENLRNALQHTEILLDTQVSQVIF